MKNTKNSVGRPPKLPETGTLLADFVIAYSQKHKIVLSNAALGEMFSVSPQTAGKWINGKHEMRGPALLRLEALKGEFL